MGRYLFRRCAMLFLAFAMIAPAAAQRSYLSASETLYPRVVRLSHGASGNGRVVASVTSFPGGRGEQQIYASDDQGRSFARIGTINDADFAKGLCCGTLYELPRAIGALTAGTLLWAGSVGGDTPGAPMQIKIYRSADRGATWSYLSNCATAMVNKSAGGLWEPEFIVAADGSLVCYYADETQTGFSQMLRLTRSTDGVNWTAPVNLVATAASADRPGMPVARRLPSGRYFLTYEVCGPPACTVYYRTSADGIDYGPVAALGTRVQTDDGRWFLHTPTVEWAPVPGQPNGRLFVIGQLVSSASGIAQGNGQIMFYNDSADGSGPWKTIAAPVPLPSPPTSSNFCQNYSSPLLASADGTSILGLATDFDTSSGSRVCRAAFATTATTPKAVLAMTAAAASMSVTKTQGGTIQLTLTPGNGYTGTARLTVAIPGYAATLSTASISFADGAARTVTMTVPGATASALLPLLLLGGAGLAVRRRRGRTGVALAAATLALAGCGGGGGGSSSAPVTSVTPPPTSTYSATVTATDTADPSITATVVIPVTVTG